MLERVISVIRRVLRDLGLVHSWNDADIRDLLRAASRVLEGRPLSEVTITEEVEVAETGEVVEVEETADIAIRRAQKRIDMAKKLRGCIAS
jgi:hypothetical protein